MLEQFDEHYDMYIDRHGSGSIKWDVYDPDVIPLWIADMDFRAPEAVLEALHRRVEHGIFGYQFDFAPLREHIIERLKTRHHIDAQPDQIHYLPGLVSGLTVMARAVGEPGSGILIQQPIYPPFIGTTTANGRVINSARLVRNQQGNRLHYEIDFDALEAAITPETRLFLFCNPHNPVGRVYTRAELERIADICLRHDLFLCSDEIHCDLLLDDHQHISIASLSPEIADRCVTLLAPSKTFNIAGLGCSFAVIQNPELARRFHAAAEWILPAVNNFGYTAALAAYRDSQAWLDATLHYLTANRGALVDFMTTHLPDYPLTVPEATYLAWIDFRALPIETSPYKFFVEQARVALNDGAAFGPCGEGYVRLNFACPRATLLQALDQMRAAIERLA